MIACFSETSEQTSRRILGRKLEDRHRHTEMEINTYLTWINIMRHRVDAKVVVKGSVLKHGPVCNDAPFLS